VKFLVFVLIVTTDVKKKNFSHSFCGHPAACGSSHKMMLQKSQKETGKGGGVSHKCGFRVCLTKHEYQKILHAGHH
jgi:hypothetical protein